MPRKSASRDIVAAEKRELTRDPAATMRAILDSIAEAVFIMAHPSGRILDVNRAACDMYGWGREEILRMQVWDLIANEEPYTAERAKGIIAEVIEGPPQRVERLDRRKDGSTFSSEVDLRAIDVGEGQNILAVVRDVSEQKRADAELKASDRRFEDVFRYAGAGLALVGADGKILQVNDSLTSILGYEEPDLLGRNFLDITHPDDVDDSFSEIKSLLRGEQGSSRMETRHLSKAGDVVWVSVTVTLVRDHRNEPAHFLVECQDLTPRKIAESARDETQAQYRRLVETMTGGIGAVDQEGRFTYVNDRLCEMLGYTKQEMLGSPLRNYLDEEDREVLDEQVARRKRGINELYELTWQARVGRPVHTLVSPQALTGPDGSYRGSFAVVTDITEHRLAQRALIQSEQQYRSLIETTETGFVVVDGEGTVLEANEEYARLTGHRSVGEVIGRTVLEWTAPHDLDRNARELERCVNEGRVRNLQLDYVNEEEGKITPIEVNGTVVETATGRRILALCRDISDRRAAEREKAQLERQLRRAQTLEAVGQLAGGVAHDFNNLLGSILGNLYGIRTNASIDPEVLGDLDRVQELCKRGGELTRQLLSLGRKGKERAEPLELEEIVASAVFMLIRTLPANVRLVQEAEPDLPRVRGNRSRLVTALLNLGLNARDAMPDGGTLTVACRRERNVRGLDGVAVHVSDTGAGIPQAIQDRVFEPFFTTKEPGRGSGLGLSTAYAAVRECDGELSVISRPDEGSSFVLWLPEGEARDVRSPEELPGTGSPHPITSDFILVVEDEEAISGMVDRLLRENGYKTLLAPTGLQALEAVRDHREEIGLVLLDLMLPKLGGEELYRLMHGLAPELTVLFITGREDLARSVDPHATILAKPFTDGDLLRCLAEVLQ